MIHILDCGSQYTRNIERALEKLRVPARVYVPASGAHAAELHRDARGIIIGGSPHSVHDADRVRIDPALYALGIPVLGICYGMQAMAHNFGAQVERTPSAGYGAARLTFARDWSSFARWDTFEAWTSHAESVLDAPAGFEILLQSISDYKVYGIVHRERPLLGVQFHPEVDDTPRGDEIFKAFVELCDIKEGEGSCAISVDAISANVPRDRIILACSGGVDSTTLAMLLKRAGADFRAVFIDNGLLRKGEAAEVEHALRQLLGDALLCVDAADVFLAALEGVADPDEKRVIIGRLFAETLAEQARAFGARMLAQGTLASDVAESGNSAEARAQIKRHHNVGGLPADFALPLYEPFRTLFKDQVRELALELGLPAQLTWRHPCPGPALAIRIDGAISAEKLEILRAVDDIFTQEMRTRGYYDDISQGFAYIAGNASGVRGDAAGAGVIVGLRAVVTRDFMTATVFPMETEAILEISRRIVTHVPGVTRVCYDYTEKPPGTIEIQ